MNALRFSRLALILLSTGLASGALRADVRLPAIIGDNMCIQQGVPARVWGWADPREEIIVSVGPTSSPKVIADDAGKWSAMLPAQKPGPVADVTIAGKNSITITNVLAGEVWVCSGQSNMQWAVKQANNAEQEIASANDKSLRFFSVQRKTEWKPVDDVDRNDLNGHWVECSPGTVPEFSAVAYFFGRDLRKALDQPIGLIHTSWGGTPAEAWTSEEALKANEILAPSVVNRQKYIDNYDKSLKAWETDHAKWAATTQAAAGVPATQPVREPNKPPAPDKNPNLASVLYNAMIHPIAPYTIKGAIWYQGEANAPHAKQYNTLLTTMITNWRAVWGQGDLPFGIVQLSAWDPPADQAGGVDYPALREAQALTAARLPNTGMVVTIDIGAGTNIHPKNKQDVGKRLSLWAQASVYGKSVEFSGPKYDGMTAEGNAVRVRFTHADGLKAKGDALRGFMIAGEDKKFIPADAKIDGDSVVISSADVGKPVAVRYAFTSNPADANLYNKDELPAVPFRTDDWATKLP